MNLKVSEVIKIHEQYLNKIQELDSRIEALISLREKDEQNNHLNQKKLDVVILNLESASEKMNKKSLITLINKASTELNQTIHGTPF